MTDNNNPYAAPQAPTPGAPPVEPTAFVRGGRVVSIGAGIDWVKEGFQIFFVAPLLWLLALILLAALFGVLSSIPFLGLLASLVGPPAMAGTIAAAEQASRERRVDFERFFVGFKEKLQPLLVIGAVSLAGNLLGIGLAFVVAGSAAAGMLLGQEVDIATVSTTIVLGALVYMAAFIPVLMATYLSPALVLFAGVAPVDAMKQSFGACLKNFLPFLVFGIVAMIVATVAAVLLFLPLLVALPALVATTYPVYRDVFMEKRG